MCQVFVPLGNPVWGAHISWAEVLRTCMLVVTLQVTSKLITSQTEHVKPQSSSPTWETLQSIWAIRTQPLSQQDPNAHASGLVFRSPWAAKTEFREMAGWLWLAEGKAINLCISVHIPQSVSVKAVFTFLFVIPFISSLIFSLVLLIIFKETWSNNNIRWKKILAHFNHLSSLFH